MVKIFLFGEDGDWLLNVMEAKYIKIYNSYYISGNGYNMTLGGDGTLGYRFTDEQRVALRNSHLGYKMPLETRLKISEANKGKRNTPEQNKKVAEATSKKWTVTCPDGHLEEIINLKEFCKNNNLRYSAMHKVSRGEMKKHRGFSVIMC